MAGSSPALCVCPGNQCNLKPRLSKIEQGHDVPSAEAIDKIAVALQRSGLDLVKGTDREGYYRAQRLTAEQEALSRRETRLEAAV